MSAYTTVQILSEAKVDENYETEEREFHSIGVDLEAEAVERELRNMGAEAIDGPEARIMFIENFMDEHFTVLVDNQDDADEVRSRLRDAEFND
ncbi:hypothetical protein ACWG8W_06070 [Citricoccus zhacaiensis]